MPPKESPTHNGGVTVSLVKCCSAKFSHTVCVQIMIFSASFLDCLFAFLENLRASEYNLLLLSSRLFPLCVRFLLVFFPVFHVFYVCMYFVYIFCMYLCVFVYICVYIFVYILFFPNVRKICSLSSEQSIRYPCSVQYICISPVLLWQYVCV